MQNAPRLYVAVVGTDVSYEFFRYQLDQWSNYHGTPEFLIADTWDDDRPREIQFIAKYSKERDIRLLVINSYTDSKSKEQQTDLDVHNVKVVAACTHALVFIMHFYLRIVELLCIAGRPLSVTNTPYQFDQYCQVMSRR